MANQRDLNHLRRLAGVPYDLSKVSKGPTTPLTEAAKVPQHRGELAPRTKKNMRQRISCAKKALEHLEAARDELMALPAVDYMEDIPDVIRQLHKILHGDDGTGGIHNLHRSYVRDFEGMEFPEDLENTEPGHDGNPTKAELRATEKEKARKAAEKAKKLKESATHKPEWLLKAELDAEEKEGDMTKPHAHEIEHEHEREEEETHKPEWLLRAELGAEEKEGDMTKRNAHEIEREHDAEDDWDKDLGTDDHVSEGHKKCSCGCDPNNCHCPPNCPCGCGKKKKAKEEEAATAIESPTGMAEAAGLDPVAGGIASKPLFDFGRRNPWVTGTTKKLAQQYTDKADANKKPMSHMATAQSPTNVVKGELDTAYPESDRSEGPNQMVTNPYNESQKIHVPPAIKEALMNEIKVAQKQADILLSRKDQDAKNFYEDMAKAFTDLHQKLDEGTVYSMKEAQILMTSMMNIFTSKIPPEVVKFIAAGGTVRPLKDYLKQVTGDYDKWQVPNGATGRK